MIDKIYEMVKDMQEGGSNADKSIDNCLREMLHSMPERPTKEQYADILNHGSSIAQAIGFESGFRYAFRLIFSNLTGEV